MILKDAEDLKCVAEFIDDCSYSEKDLEALYKFLKEKTDREQLDIGITELAKLEDIYLPYALEDLQVELPELYQNSINRVHDTACTADEYFLNLIRDKFELIDVDETNFLVGSKISLQN